MQVKTQLALSILAIIVSYIICLVLNSVIPFLLTVSYFAGCYLGYLDHIISQEEEAKEWY